MKQPQLSPGRFPALLPALLLCALLGACNYVQPSLTQQTQIVTDATVDRSDLHVYVKPVGRLHAPVKALMFPMWIRESIPARLELGRGMGRVFQDAWSEEPVFPALAMPEELVYRGRESALAQARQRGADMLVLPSVPYLYAGGTLDDSALTIRCDIYEVATGNLLVSMEQSGRLEFERNKDWVLWMTRTRMPDSPLYAITRAIAADMAVPLRSWLPPVDPLRLGFASTADEIVEGLTAPPSETALPKDGDTDLRSMDLADELGNTGGSVYIHVEFDVDKATIRPEYYNNLDELAQALKAPKLLGRKVLIIGHTDSDASEEYNLELSKRRAASVKQYLVDRHDIDPNLLATDGRGESQPLVPNTSAANKQLNRRVEVRLAE
ncbi:MAG: OmpA family protein [Desulfovibrio sp.]